MVVAIEIIRVGDLYEATVTPPHWDGIAWSTTRAMTTNDLVAALRERGCQTTDISDAFYEADPEWLLRE